MADTPANAAPRCRRTTPRDISSRRWRGGPEDCRRRHSAAPGSTCWRGSPRRRAAKRSSRDPRCARRSRWPSSPARRCGARRRGRKARLTEPLRRPGVVEVPVQPDGAVVPVRLGLGARGRPQRAGRRRVGREHRRLHGARRPRARGARQLPAVQPQLIRQTVDENGRNLARGLKHLARTSAAPSRASARWAWRTTRSASRWRARRAR